MHRFAWKKCQNIFLFHLRKLFSKFPHKSFLIILRDHHCYVIIILHDHKKVHSYRKSRIDIEQIEGMLFSCYILPAI